jgi:RNA polymerase sigma-70 factor (ECF subfamily)
MDESQDEQLSPPVDEVALLCQAQAGDWDAYEQLQRALEPLLRRVAQRLMGNADAVDDVLQDVWLSFYRHLKRIHPPENVRPYLFRMVRNRCYDTWRRTPEEPVSLDDEGQALGVAFDLAREQVSHDDALHWILLHVQVREAMDKLSPAHRTTLLLYCEDGLSYADISELTGVSLGTVKSRIFHAKRQLRALLSAATLSAIEAELGQTRISLPESDRA